MVLPRALANFNRHVTNPVAGLLAGRVPPFGVIVHRGRKSGRTYRTPVWVFSGDGEYRVALTYGADVDWLRNILASGAFQLEAKGKTIELTDPAVHEDPAAAWAPPVVRQVLSGISARYYLTARPRG